MIGSVLPYTEQLHLYFYIQHKPALVLQTAVVLWHNHYIMFRAVSLNMLHTPGQQQQSPSLWTRTVIHNCCVFNMSQLHNIVSLNAHYPNQ